MPQTTPQRRALALDELRAVIARMPGDATQPLADAIIGAKRIALHGLGREGLQMKGLCMRLYHLGLDAHVVGEMTTPAVGEGDLLIVSSGPGSLATHEALMSRVKRDGARLAAITAQPQGGVARLSDVVLHIPAQTMADDQGAKTSVLPMGSLFEAAMMIIFEILVLDLRDRLGETPETMRARHTNLE
jgi:6-phospho-3-hexuloisomerase